MSQQSGIKFLLFLIAVAAVAGVFFYVYKPNMDDKKSIEAENVKLEEKYNELKAQEAHREEYEQEIAENYAKFEEELEYFPATLDQEISVMFIKGVEKDKGNLQFGVNTVGLGKPESFYTLGAGAAGGEGAAAEAYQCYRANYPISYEGSYEGLKDFIDYVMAYKYRMNISSFTIAYNSQDDIYSGSIGLHAYCVTGGDREADKVDVDVENGVTNPFLGGEGAANVSSSSHDADQGQSIATEHDILVALNNANNDSTDGILVSAGGSDTYVTSSENKFEDLVISIKEEEGKNLVTYSIGDSSFSFELTSDELCVYVESSKRVDTEDKNGVTLSVENDTDVPVYVYVSDDDTSAPRFSLGSKTGTVKVY